MCRLSILLMMLLSISFLSSGQSVTYVERTKKEVSRYNVLQSQPLIIDNKFGHVDISTWNKNEILIEVIMTGRSRMAEQAQRILGLLAFEEDNNAGIGNAIAIKTIVKNEGPLGNGISWLDDSPTKKYEAEVSYNIHIPETTPLEVISSFGNVSIHNTYKGKLWLDLYVGEFNADSLISQPKTITIGKSKHPNHINYIEKGKIIAAEGYGTLEVDRAGDIEVVGFDTLKCKRVDHLFANRNGGLLMVDTVESMDGTIANASVDIGSLTNNAHLTFNNSPSVNIGSLGSKDMGLFLLHLQTAILTSI